MKPRSVAWPVSIAACFVAVAIIFSFLAIREAQSAEKNAQRRDRDQISQLQETLDCRARFSGQLVEAQLDWQTALVVFHVDGGTPQTIAQLDDTGTRLRAAANAQSAYDHNPVLPCPI